LTTIKHNSIMYHSISGGYLRRLLFFRQAK
jgi:hypothetical protein